MFINACENIVNNLLNVRDVIELQISRKVINLVVKRCLTRRELSLLVFGEALNLLSKKPLYNLALFFSDIRIE